MNTDFLHDYYDFGEDDIDDDIDAGKLQTFTFSSCCLFCRTTLYICKYESLVCFQFFFFLWHVMQILLKYSTHTEYLKGSLSHSQHIKKYTEWFVSYLEYWATVPDFTLHFAFFSFLLIFFAPKISLSRHEPKYFIKAFFQFIKEIRQEAVKAALANYPNQENQGAVNASKRNTAYLLPLNNALPVLAREEDTNSLETNNKMENPFPVTHGNKAITCEDILSDMESTDDELANLNKPNKIESTPNSRPSYENKPILLFNAGLADTTTISPEPAISSPSPMDNIHSNQYYDYCPAKKQVITDAPTTAETPTTKDQPVLSEVAVASPVKPTESETSSVSSPDKKPCDRVASAVQRPNGGSSINGSSQKILVPKKSKSKSKISAESTSPSTNTNSSGKPTSKNGKRSQSPLANLQQQLSGTNLNQSGSSDSGKLFCFKLCIRITCRSY